MAIQSHWPQLARRMSESTHNPDSVVVAALCGDPGHDRELRATMIRRAAKHPGRLAELIAVPVSQALHGDDTAAVIASKLLAALPTIRREVEAIHEGRPAHMQAGRGRRVVVRERFDDME